MYFFFSLPRCVHTLGSLHARPPTLHMSVIPFSDIRQEKGECKSPICTHYTECTLVNNTSRENSKKTKKKRKAAKRTALKPVTSRCCATFWYRNLCFGWHFKENATVKHKYTRGRPFYMHLNMQANPLNISSWIRMGAEISGDKHKPSRTTFINITLHSTHPPVHFQYNHFINTYNSTLLSGFIVDALLTRDSLEVVVSLRGFNSTVRLGACAVSPELRVQSWIKNIKSGAAHKVEAVRNEANQRNKAQLHRPFQHMKSW